MLAKKLIIIFILMSIVQWTFLFSQRNGNFGLLMGVSDYQGELSDGKMFKSLNGYSASLFYRSDISKRYALNGGFMFGMLPTAGDVNFFESRVLFEFSFYEFEMDDQNKTVTPYLSTGFGYNFIKSDIFLPFGVGVKMNLSNRMAMGAEWMIKKTSLDDLEAEKVGQSVSIIHNNDYYSSIGVFITYKFFKFAEDCPVY